tara:strand:- start:595 stop:1422 length:828 start_codon:yes stop_codon:yes gene_type:complete
MKLIEGLSNMLDNKSLYKAQEDQLKKNYDNSLNELKKKHYKDDELKDYYKNEIDQTISKMNNVFGNIKDGLVTDISFIKLADVYDINKDNIKDIYYKEIDNLMDIKDIENDTTVNQRLGFYESKHIDFFDGLNTTLKKIYWLLIIIILIIGFLKKQYKNIKLYLFLVFIIIFPQIVPLISMKIRERLGYIKFTGFVSVMFVFIVSIGILLYYMQKLPFMNLNALTLILGINKVIKEKPVKNEASYKESKEAPTSAPVAPPASEAPVEASESNSKD